MKNNTSKIICLLLIPFSIVAQKIPSTSKIIYQGNWADQFYHLGKSEIAVQQEMQKLFEDAIVTKVSDEWDVNMSESWSILHPSYAKQPPSIKADSAKKNYMSCKAHIEFYPKSGTALMNDYLKRAQKSNEDENQVKKKISEKEISRQEAQIQLQNINADIWGAPTHLEIISNDFPLSDSLFIAIPVEVNRTESKKIDVAGADWSTLSKQINNGNAIWVTMVYLGKYSADKEGNLQIQHPTSANWRKQNSITIKIYGPADIAQLLLKKFDLSKLKSALK